MANICENTFYIYDKDSDKISKIGEEFTKLFERTLWKLTYFSEGVIEGYCESKWTYPKSTLTPLIDKYEPEYFRCISSEPGCGYYSCHIYTDNGWKDPQYFDLYI